MEIYQPIISYHAPFDVNLQIDNMLDVSNNVIPLWTSKNLQLRYDEEYLNFEIIDKNSDCDSEDGVQDNTSYIDIETNIQKSLCHICNVEVPSGYMLSHQNSEKHKTYVKISEIALERVRRQMSETYTSENKIPSMYFCQSCVVLVPKNDKQLHLISIQHKNSIIIDKLLNDFSKLYFDDAIDIEKELKHKKIVSTEPIIEEDELINLNNDESDEITVSSFDNLNPNDVDELIIQPIELPLDEELKIIIDNLNTDITKYKLEYLDKDYVIILTEDGVKFKLKHENFHSFYPLDIKHVQCKLCCQIARNLKEHIFEEEHLTKLALPIDKNCIRKIDDSKGHCILCNEIIHNPDIHALCDKNHDILMIKAMIFDKDDTKVTEIVQNKNEKKDNNSENTTFKDPTIKKREIASKYYFCNVCYIPVNKKDTEIHCDDPKHISNAKIESHYLLDYSYALSKLRCTICKIYFPINKMKDHLKNYQHKSTYDALLTANYLKKTTKNIFCELCIVYMRIGNEIKHIESLGHVTLLKSKTKAESKTDKKTNKASLHAKDTKDNVQKIDENKPQNVTLVGKNNTDMKSGNDKVNVQLNSNQKSVTCKVCDIKMLDNEKDVKNHLLKYHKIDDTKSVKENSKMRLTGNLFICETCCEYVTIEDELKHLSSPTHIVKALRKSDIDDNKINVQVKKDDTNNNQLPSTSKDIIFMPRFKKTDTKKKRYCFICATSVYDDIDSIQRHENGKKHNSNFESILKINKIEDRDVYLQCTLCCMPLEKNELITHINSDYHLRKENVKKGVTTVTYCDTCQKFITTKIEAHILSAAHKSREIPKNVASYLCHLCDVSLTNSNMNIKEHNDGSQHKNNVKMLDDNTIKISDDNFYCETCEMSVTYKLIRQHINTSKHLILMGNDVPK
ncbi:uncharacterized protein LOC106713429 isoform X1 [Papilio machaon]|uniref:uncharacterized protein LOC106713429 isoform X1 n=1 Tax=Papilio machaon TaxID=76193 RepID=UPI001E6659D7|nr:uncharacterized protein LOC106713429 isoform X1 [Papilio machaon]